MPSLHIFHSYYWLFFSYSCSSKHLPYVYGKLSSGICGAFSSSVPRLSADNTESYSSTHSKALPHTTLWRSA